VHLREKQGATKMNTRADVAYALAKGKPLVALAPCTAWERRLAAILSADVQGYSRLLSEDEEATIRTLTAYRTMFSTLVAQHYGRVVDSPGDNILAEFAIAVQRGTARPADYGGWRHAR
jgi:class 3 adenylate cyclase